MDNRIVKDFSFYHINKVTASKASLESLSKRLDEMIKKGKTKGTGKEK